MGIENLLLGFHVAITPYNLFVAVVGITLGTIIGVLPGLGGANGVAILLPLTFTMQPTSVIILLTSLYWGALFGGAITSILFNIPGEPWSVATTFDGYPLARQGQGGQALTAAFTSSFVGALFSIVLITLFAPLLAEIALKFGPPEFFAIQLLTFSSFVGLGGGNPLKSLASFLIGFILADAGFVLEFCVRQALLPPSRALRQGFARGRRGARDGGPRGRRRRHAAHDHPRHPRLSDGRRHARRPHHLGIAARPDALQGAAGL